MGGFCFTSATIQTHYLSLVADDLTRTTEELPQGNIKAHVHMGRLNCWWLVQGTKCGSENWTIKLTAAVITNIVERVHLEEKVVKDLVTIVLVAVSASANYKKELLKRQNICTSIRSHDARSEGVFPKLLVDCFKLRVGQNLECLTNQLELRFVHPHLLRILHWVHLKTEFLKPKHWN